MSKQTIKFLEELLAKAKAGDLISVNVVSSSNDGYYFFHEGNGFELYGMTVCSLKRIEEINNSVYKENIE